MQKQKYNIPQILQRYFYNTQSSHQCKTKSLPSKYVLYRKNDPVNSLYIFLEGTIKMSIDNKQIILQPPLLIGDYEPLNQISKRITDVKIIKKSKFIVVTIEALFNLKTDQKKIILQNICFRSRALRYLFQKSLVQVQSRKNDVIDLQTKIGLITEGIFQLSKFITLTQFKKHNLQMKKNFDIAQFHPYQIVYDKSLTCTSEKGRLFQIQKRYFQVFSFYYQEFRNFYEEIVASQKYYESQIAQIKNTYKQQKQLTQTFVPYLIAKQQQNIQKHLDYISPKSLSLPAKTPKVKSLIQQSYIDPNKTTFVQFLDRQQKQKLKIKPKVQKRSNTEDLSKYRKQKLETIDKKLSSQKIKRRNSQLQIPQSFMQTKFKMKMFLRAKISFQSGGFRNPAQKRYSQNLNKSLSPVKRLLLHIQSLNS